MRIQRLCSITHKMQPGVVLFSFSLSVRSCLYCGHGIGRIAAPLCPMGTEFFTRQAVPYLKRLRLPCIARWPSGGPLTWSNSRAELGTTPSPHNAIQSRPKQHRNDSTSHPQLCWMSLDELGRPIGQHRKRDEETSKRHPKPVWMSIGVAVTIGGGWARCRHRGLGTLGRQP